MANNSEEVYNYSQSDLPEIHFYYFKGQIFTRKPIVFAVARKACNRNFKQKNRIVVNRLNPSQLIAITFLLKTAWILTLFLLLHPH